MPYILIFIAILILGVGALLILRYRNLDRWILPYWTSGSKRKPPTPGEEVHVLLCIADHFESGVGIRSPKVCQQRIDHWTQDYPRLFADFRDSDGRPPRHSYFYAIEQYQANHLEAIAELCRRGLGEVELHLHHDDDTSEGFREALLEAKRRFGEEHGVLSRHRSKNELQFAFIHGDWALNNSRPDGRHCGVSNELDILRETGCYADMTLPSAPSATQTRKINSIYYAQNRPNRVKSHDVGVDLGEGPRPANSLMLIQGPLLLDWGRRKLGILPHIENACIQQEQPPTIQRLHLWLKARVQVPQRPDWFFVKLHTHGLEDRNRSTILGDPMVRFHEALAQLASENPKFHYHYVTAREMTNLARAAESGFQGSVDEARDFELVWNGSLRSSQIDRKSSTVG